MIDKHLLPYVKSSLAPLAKFAKRHGVKPDQVTIFGFFLGVIAVPLIANGHYIWGLVFILLNRVLDGLDGILARELGTTDRGAFLDITLDFWFYALIPLGFALAAPQNALAAAFLLTSFIGTGTSFLAFSLLAERRHLKSIDYPSKGIYYLGGLTEGFETIMFFVLICLFPSNFVVLALIYGAMCYFTSALRIYYGYKTFTDK